MEGCRLHWRNEPFLNMNNHKHDDPDCTCQHINRESPQQSSPACFHLLLAWLCAAPPRVFTPASVMSTFRQSNHGLASIEMRNLFHQSLSKGIFRDLCWTKVLEMIILLAHVKKMTKKKCLHLTIFRPSLIVLAHLHLQSK